MGNDNTGASVHDFCQRILNLQFGFGIYIGSGFVQDQQNIGVSNQRPCKRQKLFLPGRKRRAAFFDFGLIAVRQARDKVVYANIFAALNDSLEGDRLIVHAKVALDCAAKQIHILQHHADVLAEVALHNVAHIHAVH